MEVCEICGAFLVIGDPNVKLGNYFIIKNVSCLGTEISHKGDSDGAYQGIPKLSLSRDIYKVNVSLLLFY